MPKKWIGVRGGPEAKTYFVEVKVPRIRKRRQPAPPPNFTPDELIRTADEEHPPILTQAQAVSQALDKKQDEAKPLN